MPRTPEISAAFIVLLGHFNPLIFRPDWLVKKKILTEKELDGVEIGVVIPEIVSFGIKPWLKVSVEQSKFSASVLQDPIVKLFDFVVGCFSELQETPIAKIGINREMHFNLGTEEKWHALGDKLAPKQPWGNFVTSEKGKRLGGLTSIAMKQKPRVDGLNGEMSLKVEPSSLIKYGAHFQVNDHYDLSEDNSLKDAKEAVELLKKQWKPSIEKSEALIKSIVNQV